MALREAAGVGLRIEPGDSDLARAQLLRTGAVDFALTVVGGSLVAQEGVFEFGAKDWGPQKVRLVLASSGEPFQPVITAGAKRRAGRGCESPCPATVLRWVPDKRCALFGMTARGEKTRYGASGLLRGGLNFDDVPRQGETLCVL